MPKSAEFALISNKVDTEQVLYTSLQIAMSEVVRATGKMNAWKFADRQIIYKTFFTMKHRSQVNKISNLDNTNMHSWVGSIIKDLFNMHDNDRWPMTIRQFLEFVKCYLAHRHRIWDREDPFDGILNKYIQYDPRHFDHNVIWWLYQLHEKYQSCKTMSSNYKNIYIVWYPLW